MKRAAERIERGRFNEALAAYGRIAGVPWAAALDFGWPPDPRQDLLYEGQAQDPALRERALSLLAAARRADPVDPGPWILEGAVHWSFQDYGAARRAFERALALEPASRWALLWDFRALAYQAMRDKDVAALPAALAKAADALRRDPGNPAGFVWRAELHTGFDLHDQALADLDRALALDPGLGWAYAEKADIFTQQHRLAEALEACAGLFRLYPGQGWVYAIRGRSYGKCGAVREALADLDRAVRAGPPLGSLRAWRGEARRQAGDLAGARRDFDAAARLDPAFPLTWLWRGKTRTQLGDPAGAESDLDRALALDPRNALAYGYRGEARIKAGRSAAGVADMGRLHPTHPAGVWSGDLQEDLDRLAAAAPEDPWLLAFRGRVRLDGADPAGIRAGLADLERALERLPDCAFALAWKGQALQKLGEPEAARRCLERAAALDPSGAWTQAWLGRVLFELGDTAAASAALDRAVALDPTAGTLYAWRGEIRLRLGRAGALEDLSRAAALGARDAGVRELLKQAVAG